MMEDDEMNYDDRVTDFVEGGRPLKTYVEFVTKNNILDKAQIRRFKAQIKNIETEAHKYSKATYYWPGVHEWVFRNN